MLDDIYEIKCFKPLILLVVIFLFSVNTYAQTNDLLPFNTWTNKDGIRLVRVMRESGEAILDDISENNSFTPIFLTTNVKSVQFTASSQIELILKNGDTKTFDINGKSINSFAREILFVKAGAGSFLSQAFTTNYNRQTRMVFLMLSSRTFPILAVLPILLKSV